jgi:hypothetical protein
LSGFSGVVLAKDAAESERGLTLLTPPTPLWQPLLLQLLLEASRRHMLAHFGRLFSLTFPCLLYTEAVGEWI